MDEPSAVAFCGLDTCGAPKGAPSRCLRRASPGGPWRQAFHLRLLLVLRACALMSVPEGWLPFRRLKGRRSERAVVVKRRPSAFDRSGRKRAIRERY